jgi:hypothetical protein
MSPTETGCLKTKESFATLDLAWRIAGTEPAMSTT